MSLDIQHPMTTTLRSFLVPHKFRAVILAVALVLCVVPGVSADPHFCNSIRCAFEYDMFQNEGWCLRVATIVPFWG